MCLECVHTYGDFDDMPRRYIPKAVASLSPDLASVLPSDVDVRVTDGRSRGECSWRVLSSERSAGCERSRMGIEFISQGSC